MLRRECGVPTRVLECNEVAHVRNGELVHQDRPTRCNDPRADRINVIDTEGSLETACGFAVQELAPLLDRPDRGSSGLVDDLDEAGRAVVLELPSENRSPDRVRARRVVHRPHRITSLDDSRSPSPVRLRREPTTNRNCTTHRDPVPLHQRRAGVGGRRDSGGEPRPADPSTHHARHRRRACILTAVAMLADGDSDTSVALRVGYASPSSFIAAFRAELDSAPREFMRTTSMTTRSADPVAPADLRARAR